jgi:hypothetical protein
MSSDSESSRRLSIAQRQLEAAAGADLLDLLGLITADGKIELADVQRLRDWLFAHAGANLPAITRLTGIVVRLLENGVITESDKTGLYLAIERVLPVTAEGIARARRDSADGPAGQDEGAWREGPLSEAQRKYLQALGGKIADPATQGEAAEVIDQLLRQKPISSRQQMVLRFWNQEPGRDDGPREVADWQERFYAEDPDRRAAWELFEQGAEDNGLPEDPLRVPLGVGPTYLARIKAGGTQTVPDSGPGSTGFKFDPASRGVRWLIWGLAAGVIATICFFVFRPRPTVPAPSRAIEPHVAPPVVVAIPAPRTDPAAADASMAKLRLFARAMNFTGLLTISGERVVLINGGRFRVGDKIGPTGEYSVIEINLANRSVVLGDKKGNSVRRMIE